MDLFRLRLGRVFDIATVENGESEMEERVDGEVVVFAFAMMNG